MPCIITDLAESFEHIHVPRYNGTDAISRVLCILFLEMHIRSYDLGLTAIFYIFDIHLNAYNMCANSDGSGEHAHMRMLA